MRVRPQSYLLPAALLILMFFSTAAYSVKKNGVNGKDADRGIKIYNKDYKKRAAERDGDIIAFNSKSKADYAEPDSSTDKENTARPAKKKKDTSCKTFSDTCFYIVKTGDTLFGIAKRSGISLKKLQDLNSLEDDSKIYKGMKLKVPASGKNNKEYKDEEEMSGKTAVSGRPAFSWPLKKVKGYSRDGIDGVKPIGLIIKGNPGSEVIASENGVVKKVGYMRGYGKYIVVKHDKKYITVYSNLLEVEVKAGDAVQKGGRIGNISNDMTLHFQIDRGGKPENPLNLLPGRG